MAAGDGKTGRAVTGRGILSSAGSGRGGRFWFTFDGGLKSRSRSDCIPASPGGREENILQCRMNATQSAGAESGRHQRPKQRFPQLIVAVRSQSKATKPAGIRLALGGDPEARLN